MKINRPLAPQFLKDAEHKLLTGQPEIWSTRAHLVIYYELIFIIALAAISFVIPLDVRKPTSVEYWIGFVSIISIIALTIWLIYLLRFNVFKRFGFTGPVNRLVTFVLYFISTGVIVFFNYVNPIVESVRANNAFGDEEIVQDINDINTKICQLEYNSLKHTWTKDTLLVVDSLEVSKYYEQEGTDVVVATGADEPRDFTKIDTAMLRERIKHADSLVKLNDSIYVEFKCPQYVFVNTYYSDNYTQQKQFTSADMYRRTIEGFKPPANKTKIRNELLQITDKYLNGIDTTEYYIDVNSNAFSKIRQRYHVSDVQTSMTNILSKKYRWKELPVFVYIFYYITLSISLLVFILRHSTVKTFFLSLLAAVIISILTVLVLAFGWARGLTFLSCMLGYALLFFIISLMVWRSKTRTIITGIALNLFVFMVPFIPLLLTSWYYQYLDWKNIDVYPAVLYHNADYVRNIIISQIAGFVLLLILTGTYIHSAYRRWFSLPEE